MAMQSLKIKKNNVNNNTVPTYWWGRYQGKSLGKVLHFIQCYCGMPVAELVDVGTNYVKLSNVKIATYDWKVESLELPNGDVLKVDVPVFNFNDQLYSEAQSLKLSEALRSLDVYRFAYGSVQ